MACLIEMDGPIGELINLRAGDLLVLTASGGRVLSGDDVIELLGPFYPGYLSAAGERLELAGTPKKLMLLPRNTGTATIQTLRGDSGSTPKISFASINVGP